MRFTYNKSASIVLEQPKRCNSNDKYSHCVVSYSFLLNSIEIDVCGSVNHQYGLSNHQLQRAPQVDEEKNQADTNQFISLNFLLYTGKSDNSVQNQSDNVASCESESEEKDNIEPMDHKFISHNERPQLQFKSTERDDPVHSKNEHGNVYIDRG